MVLFDSMSDRGSLEGADMVFSTATYNRPSVLPFPHTDISKTSHHAFFRPPTKSRPHPPHSHPGKARPKHFPLPQSLNPLFLFHSHSLTAESRRDIRRKLPCNIALGRELAVQIVRTQTITALVRRPRAANLLTTLPHQLREVVC
jgi:hypothetical protein